MDYNANIVSIQILTACIFSQARLYYCKINTELNRVGLLLVTPEARQQPLTCLVLVDIQYYYSTIILLVSVLNNSIFLKSPFFTAVP